MKLSNFAQNAVVALSLTGLVPPALISDDASAAKQMDKKAAEQLPVRTPAGLTEAKDFNRKLLNGNVDHIPSYDRARYEYYKLYDAGKYGEAKLYWRNYLTREDHYGHHAIRREIPTIDSTGLMSFPYDLFKAAPQQEYVIIADRFGKLKGYAKFEGFDGGKLSFRPVELSDRVRAQDDWIILKKNR